jgi:ABC-2 type transport system ATP-binding protein
VSGATSSGSPGGTLPAIDRGHERAATDAVIVTRGLAKRYGRVRAVDGIDLDVRAGDVYGFLGANGSGKTTTVRMLLGLVLPTSGEVEVLGERMPRAGRRVLPRVGALIEGPAFYGHLPGRENLSLLDASGPGSSRRTRRRRIEQVLEQVGLAGVGRRPVKAYSLGMRQRLGLAGALLRRPELLVLDEPTNGLDPQGIAEIRALLLELHRGGTTVFLSSHLLAEIEQMATRVGVLDRGRLVLQEELSVLTAPTGATVVTTPEPGRARALLDGRVTEADGARLVVRGSDPAEVNARLVAGGVPVTGLELQRPTLEQVVLAAARGSGDRISGPTAGPTAPRQEPA